jgi:D-alanyl-lipoteichoic acid acyltransferase DltB (MBOAT superfamily)
MLFNSYPFLLVFLPLALVLFHGLLRSGRRTAAVLALTVMSIVFFGYEHPQNVALLLGSVAANFAFGAAISRTGQTAGRRGLLAAGIALNLGLLGYFKYAGFLVLNLDRLAGLQVPVPAVALPLGISFYTFLQIAYLVDRYRGLAATDDLLRYTFFVSFFPHLIAGPLVHHAELVPQLDRNLRRRLGLAMASGLTMLVIGLVKKVIVADGFALGSSPVFDTVHADGVTPDLLSAWTAASCYTLQIYFDFSAYSDMACGLSRMFGLRLPINFASPYKAHSLIDFWRRWHITLSRFLRDYLYFPLGGGRRGRLIRYRNLLLTMLLGGLWHGAGWTFIIWGAIHGVLLAVNHAWQEATPAGLVPAWAGRLLTFLVVLLAWVPFRSADLPTALRMWSGMLGGGGIVLPDRLAPLLGVLPMAEPGRMIVPLDFLLLWIPMGLAVVWLLPNTYELMRVTNPVIATPGYPATYPAHWARWLRWRPNPLWTVVTALAFTACLLKLNDVSEFIYFQF